MIAQVSYRSCIIESIINRKERKRAPDAFISSMSLQEKAITLPDKRQRAELKLVMKLIVRCFHQLFLQEMAITLPDNKQHAELKLVMKLIVRCEPNICAQTNQNFKRPAS